MKINSLGMKRILIVFLACTGGEIAAQQKLVKYNDRTGLNTTMIQAVQKPQSVSEIQEIVRKSQGSVSIAGGRYSQGGQIIATHGTVIDMCNMREIKHIGILEQTITVQAGASWFDIQQAIDKYNFSVAIMQSYCDFSVGGSISVNVHGRYMGKGPVAESVISMKVVLADGSLVTVSRTENPDLFSAVIGGYGAAGIIVEATLKLDHNEKMERSVVVMSIDHYEKFFFSMIKGNSEVILHNANVHPDDYQQVISTTWYKTNQDLTISDRFKPVERINVKNIIQLGLMKRMWGMKWLRAYSFDSSMTTEKKVVMRNYEAGYHVNELSYPTWFSVSLLQEYFVPVENMTQFTNKMRDIFHQSGANILNVSIRHVEPNNDSLLSWCTKESFAFVIYYEQWKSDKAYDKAKVWTQKLIDAVLECGGTYYLPYKIYATPEQFKKAYPHFDEFLDVKKKYDPTKKFGNALWEAYN